MATIVFSGNTDLSDVVDFDKLKPKDISLVELTSSAVEIDFGGLGLRLTGDFEVSNNDITSGTVDSISMGYDGDALVSISDFEIDIEEADVLNGPDGLFGELDALLSGPDTFTGSAFGDEFYTEGGADSLFGGGGKDILFGGNGNDAVNGGAGKDLLGGGGGNDKVFGDGGADRIDGGAGNDKLLGGGGNDKLIGGDGRDKLFGDAGKDRLDGGAGNDKLTGGDKADTFVLSYGGGRDTVLDFSGSDGDQLRLDRNLWTDRLNAAGVIDEYAKVNGKGDTVLKFDGGERLTLKGFDDLDYLSDSLSLFW